MTKKGPHRPVRTRSADWRELANPWAPFVFARLVPHAERQCYPHVCYGQMHVDARRVFLMRGRQRRLVDELAAAVGLPDDIAGNIHAMTDHLEDLYSHHPAAEFVIVLRNADLVQDLDYWIALFHRVGERYAESIDQGAHFDRPAMPFHAVLECESEDGLGRVNREIWRETGESTPVPQLGASPFVEQRR